MHARVLEFPGWIFGHPFLALQAHLRDNITEKCIQQRHLKQVGVVCQPVGFEVEAVRSTVFGPEARRVYLITTGDLVGGRGGQGTIGKSTQDHIASLSAIRRRGLPPALIKKKNSRKGLRYSTHFSPIKSRSKWETRTKEDAGWHAHLPVGGAGALAWCQ